MELTYGPSPDERLDFFPAARPGAPLLVFVHGGYWQELGKSDSAFPALAIVGSGGAFAAVGYGLAPRYGMDEIVGMVRRSLSWLGEHAGRLGIAADDIHLAGSSAGAHLAMMCLLAGPPAVSVRSAVLLSGVYDLEPIRLSYVNDVLGMDEAAARRNSPLHQISGPLPPLVVARGEHETDEFARQHGELVAAVRLHTSRLTDLCVAGRNHFDVAFDISEPGTGLGRAVLSAMGLEG
jgi:arylformamidase